MSVHVIMYIITGPILSSCVFSFHVLERFIFLGASKSMATLVGKEALLSGTQAQVLLLLDSLGKKTKSAALWVSIHSIML